MKQKKINPFLEENKITYFNKSTEAGSSSKDGSFYYQGKYSLETQNRTIVYRKKEFEKSIYNLQTQGLKLLNYIIFHLTYNSDKINLDPKKYESVTGLGEQSFNKGRAQLIKIGVIKKKSPKIYWVNPHLIFNGNKLKWVEETYGSEYKVNVSELKLREDNQDANDFEDQFDKV